MTGKSIAILGAGMAGFGAAYRFQHSGVRPVLYEKMPYYGGHTASEKFPSGFIFDEGPHVSFTKDRRIQELFAQSVGNQYETVSYAVNNYWQGRWIKHPAHCNLYGLPPSLVVDIIADFVRSRDQQSPPPSNYEQWLVASYGEKFARTFPMEYTLKYHTTEARNLGTDWLGPRMYRPSLEEVLLGALTPSTPNVHYVTEFRYPSRGGFVSYLSLFLGCAELKCGHELTGIDPVRRELRFANGTAAPYDGLVSSLPLPELIPMIDRTPRDVLEAAAALACSSCVVVSVGVNRRDLSEAHISYFYDRDIVFTRLSFPSMMSPHNAPPGHGSIQAEIYYSGKYKPLDRTPGDCIPAVIGDLKKCGILREEDAVVFTHHKVIPYANVIFDHDRAGALAVVHEYLDELGIAHCGRYGDWAYIWTDEAFISGEAAAQHVIDTHRD